MTDIVVRIARYRDRGHYVMYFTDPTTEKRKFKTTHADNRKDAILAAAEWERELRSGRPTPDGRIEWQEFLRRFEDEHLSGLAPASRHSYLTALAQFDRVIHPARLSSVTSSVISDYVATVRKAGRVRETTIAARLRHLKGALRWAVRVGLLAEPPKITMPKRAKGVAMRGRPITMEEFERMIEAVAKIRPTDTARWQRFLMGLWLSGLRLGEALRLSWDLDQPLSIDLAGKHPRLKLLAEGHKAHRDQLLPITPEFADFLLATPPAERIGRVFELTTRPCEGPIDINRASRIVSAIGRSARVVTSKDHRTGRSKFASAHDLRRSFATTWSTKVRPVVLQKLMRHESFATTMSYYVSVEADDVGDEIWREHDAKIHKIVNKHDSDEHLTSGANDGSSFHGNDLSN